MKNEDSAATDKISGKKIIKINKREKHNLRKLHTFFKFRLLWTAYIFKLEL
jgi:hypothetical protein